MDRRNDSLFNLDFMERMLFATVEQRINNYPGKAYCSPMSAFHSFEDDVTYMFGKTMGEVT